MTNKDNTRFAKLSGDLWANAKFQMFAATNPHAAIIWVTALSYSADRYTDGYFDTFTAMRMFAATQDDLDALTEAGLLELAEDGMYHIHDYEQYQLSKAAIDDISAKRSAAGKQGGRPKTVANTSEKTNQKANGKQNESKTKANQKQNKPNAKQSESKKKLDIDIDIDKDIYLSPIVPLQNEKANEKQNESKKQNQNQIQTQSKNPEPASEPDSKQEQDTALANMESEQQDESFYYIELESIIDDDITPVDEAEPCPKQPLDSPQTDETGKREQIPMSARKRRTQGNLVNLNQHPDMSQTAGQPLARNNLTQPTITQMGGKWGNTHSRDKPDKMTANLHHNLTMVAQMRQLDQQQAQEQPNYVNA